MTIETAETMLQKKIWAVIGANDDRHKYANRIYRKLKARGYTVYPVNPNFQTIEGDPCYPDITALPEKPEVLNLVVAPKHGRKVIEAAATLGIKNIWLQPTTYDQELLTLIAAKEMQAVQGCVLVSLAKSATPVC